MLICIAVAANLLLLLTLACATEAPTPSPAPSSGQTEAAPMPTPSAALVPPAWHVANDEDALVFSIEALQHDGPPEIPTLRIRCSDPDKYLPAVSIHWGGAWLTFPKRGPRSTQFYVAGIWTWGDGVPTHVLYERLPIHGDERDNEATYFRGQGGEDFFVNVFQHLSLAVETVETEQLSATFALAGLRDLMDQHGGDLCPRPRGDRSRKGIR